MFFSSIHFFAEDDMDNGSSNHMNVNDSSSSESESESDSGSEYEEPYEFLPKSQIYVYDHYGTNGKYGAVQTSRVLLQLNEWREDILNDEEPFKLKLDHIHCKNRFRGLSVYNPSTKHLGMSNCLKNQNEFKKLPTYWDTISKLTSIQKFDYSLVKDFIRLLRELLQINKTKRCLLSGLENLNHRIRFEFYSNSTLLGDDDLCVRDTLLPDLQLNELLVYVEKDYFVDYQKKQFVFVNHPIECLLNKCYILNVDELRDFYLKLTPQHLSTLAFCLERSVEMLNLIGFSGRISSYMKKLMSANPDEICIPWTNIPVACFDQKRNSNLSDFAMFVERFVIV